MQIKNLQIIQVLLLTVAVAICVLVVFRPQRHDDPNTFNWHNLPKEGFAENDTHGEVPGDMENGVRGLHKLYGVIQTFRTRNGGRYPTNIRELLADSAKAPGVYGFSSMDEYVQSSLNPDNKYGDGMVYTKPNRVSPYSLTGLRPDGTPVGGPKPAGMHDLIGATNLYVHRNIRVFPHEKSTENPVGAYLLLWDDGTVTKLPYDKILYVQTGSHQWKPGFPGQVGLPQTGVQTYDQFYRGIGFKSGPRGTPGGPGKSSSD